MGPMRVAVVTPSGAQKHIYADRIDDLSGPGEPRPGPLPSIMSAEVFAEGRQDGTIIAGADLELLAKLQPGAHILVVPGSRPQR